MALGEACVVAPATEMVDTCLLSRVPLGDTGLHNSSMVGHPRYFPTSELCHLLSPWCKHPNMGPHLLAGAQ